MQPLTLAAQKIGVSASWVDLCLARTNQLLFRQWQAQVAVVTPQAQYVRDLHSPFVGPVGMKNVRNMSNHFKPLTSMCKKQMLLQCSPTS